MKDLPLSARLAMADKNPDSQDVKLRSVRRRLNFGEDHDSSLPSKDELEHKFAEERARHLEEKKAKWNFDFKEERPLEGHWEWERVEKPEPSRSTTDAAAPENTDSGAKQVKGDAEDQAP